MAAPRSTGGRPQWQANGFPPRTFPVEAGNGQRPAAAAGPDGGLPPAPPPPPPAHAPPRRGRGRWIAAAVALLAVLLLAAALLLLRGGDDEADLTTGTSSTLAPADTSVPAFDATTLVTPVSLEPVVPTTLGPTPGTTPRAATTTTPTTAGRGVLEISPSAIAIPRVDATVGPEAAGLTLRNAGPSAFTYQVQPGHTALSASPAQGTIPPGGTVQVTVRLDGAKVAAEGPFSATLGIVSSGGTRAVAVTSTVGRPPLVLDDIANSCTTGAATCSRQINLSTRQPGDSPCTTTWGYAVRIIDQSQVQAKVVARITRAGSTFNADTSLGSATATGGPREVYVSQVMPQLQPGDVLRFFIEAVDQHGFVTRLAQETISCPVT